MRVGSLLTRRALRRFRRRVDYSEYGGAPLLGVAGVDHRRPRPLERQGGAQRRRHGLPLCGRSLHRARRAGHRRRRGVRTSDRVHLSRTGFAEGRHGQGARRRLPDLPRDLRRGRRGARRAAQPPRASKGPRTSSRSPRTRSRRSSRSASPRTALLESRGHRRRRSSPATASASTRPTSPPARSRSPTRCGSCGGAAATCRRPCRSATGAMAAILGLDADTVAQACAEAAEGEVVSPANLNGAGQVVIAGARDAVERAGERAKALGAKRVVPLPVSAPFHCALMKPAAGSPRAGAARAGDARRRACRSSPTSTPSRSATRAAAIEALVRRCRRRCAGKRSCARLASEGVTTYVEVGPGTVLSGLVRKIHREATVVELRQPGRSRRAVEALLAHRRCSISPAKWRSSPARRAASAARSPTTLAAQGATVVAAARGDHAGGDRRGDRRRSGRPGRGGRRRRHRSRGGRAAAAARSSSGTAASTSSSTTPASRAISC